MQTAVGIEGRWREIDRVREKIITRGPIMENGETKTNSEIYQTYLELNIELFLKMQTFSETCREIQLLCENGNLEDLEDDLGKGG